jgi:hypothetical protein
LWFPIFLINRRGAPVRFDWRDDVREFEDGWMGSFGREDESGVWMLSSYLRGMRFAMCDCGLLWGFESAEERRSFSLASGE